MAGTWVFVRGVERVEIRRWDREQGGGLVIQASGHTDERWFDSVESLMAFQNRVEEGLVSVGWSLDEYFPDRRLGRDRRSMSRTAERRRRLIPFRHKRAT